MITRFTLFDKTLHLERYPLALQHHSWQAWDSADELLIGHVIETYSDWADNDITIMNDDFGALACWFNQANLCWVNDSFIATKSCQINLHKNQFSEANIHFQDCLSPLLTAPDIVLMKIPKTVALLEHQLIQLQSVITPKTHIIAAGKAKSIQKSTLALFEKHLGPTTTSLAKKKSRLIFCQPTAKKQTTSPYPTVWQVKDSKLSISNHANVFSRQQLDIGARFLLENLPDCQGKKVIDLGCGNGVIGLHVMHRYPDARVTFVDESFMAISSAKENVSTNLPAKLSHANFIAGNCLEDFDKKEVDGRPELVICNPPFHQQNAITDHIAYQMFKDAHALLKKGGELRIIGNRHLDYPQKLKRLFGGFSVVASNNKFSILSAIKR